ncbi:proton gradient regulation 7 [Tasmannia lanceolata]|uniref:proton gradient regulation 7 n=1 Tax=Tasmannia lanceolata TaxID=3420 RepID=UPI004062D5AC
MIPSTNSLISPPIPSIFPSSLSSKPFSVTTFFALPPRKNTLFNPLKQNPCLKSPINSPKCSVSVAQTITPKDLQTKPSPAEVSRTIMELSSVGTLSTLTQEGWPLGIGVRFVVDSEGTPILCLNPRNRQFSMDRRSTLHVQLEQCGSRTPQCTLQGSLNKPDDRLVLKELHAIWAKRFGEEVDEDLMYVVAVEQVLQMEDFWEDGIWVTSSKYINATPDPLRNCAEKLATGMNANHMEDVHRFCNVYVDLGFLVTEAKMIWVDRLGFDVRLRSQDDLYEVRIPFPREVTDEKAAKSSFNCMSQLAWEVEKNYTAPEFEKVKHLKEIGHLRASY